MRILVVCGAGASSTFVALRLRRAAASAGLHHLTAIAGTWASLATDLDTADVVFVGAHLERSLDEIHALAAPRGVRVVPLPDDIYTDSDGTRALALATAVAPSDVDSATAGPA